MSSAHLPGRHGGERDDHQVRPVEAVPVVETVDEGYRLHRLAQTHLICKDHRVGPEEEGGGVKGRWVGLMGHTHLHQE